MLTSNVFQVVLKEILFFYWSYINIGRKGYYSYYINYFFNNE